MAEVNTGGLKDFKYPKGYQPKLDESLKKDIQSAYGQYYERKAREDRNKRILLIIAGLIILVLLGFAFWKLF